MIYAFMEKRISLFVKKIVDNACTHDSHPVEDDENDGSHLVSNVTDLIELLPAMNNMDKVLLLIIYINI